MVIHGIRGCFIFRQMGSETLKILPFLDRKFVDVVHFLGCQQVKNLEPFTGRSFKGCWTCDVPRAGGKVTTVHLPSGKLT